MDCAMIEVANQIADAACTLDWLKNYAPECERAEAAQQVEKLHDLAQAIAGPRVNEVYCLENVHA